MGEVEAVGFDRFVGASPHAVAFEFSPATERPISSGGRIGAADE